MPAGRRIDSALEYRNKVNELKEAIDRWGSIRHVVSVLTVSIDVTVRRMNFF